MLVAYKVIACNVKKKIRKKISDCLVWFVLSQSLLSKPGHANDTSQRLCVIASLITKHIGHYVTR